MKKALIGGGLGLFGLFVLWATPTWAESNWELNAPRQITFSCGGTDFAHTLNTISNESNGDLSGTGYYNPDHSYTWDMDGNITGDHIDLTIVYTGINSGYTLNLTGNINADGSISGDSDGNCQSFSMGSGSAEDLDSDDDGILNKDDNCPDDANSDQLDSDHDGRGDVCENNDEDNNDDEDNDHHEDNHYDGDCEDYNLPEDSKACYLLRKGVPGNGILTAPGLRKPFNNNKKNVDYDSNNGNGNGHAWGKIKNKNKNKNR